MMKMTVTVTPNGQTKTIGQWNCSGYDVSIQMMMMPLKMAVWASTDVPLDMEKFSKLYSNVLKAQLNLDETAAQEMMKVKGYWIASETTGEVMGGWQMFVWISMIAMLGLVMSIPMKQQMINIEQLRFPSGIAAAETLRALHSKGEKGARAARALGKVVRGFGL
jgi:hypothetical protein